MTSILKSRDITLPTKVYIVKAMVFPAVMFGSESWTIRKLSAKELMLLNCGVGEDSWESIGRSNQSIQRKSVLNIHWKHWCWSWSSNSLSTWCEELTHWKRPWCWAKPKAGGEGDDSGWVGWMASLTWWTWVWVSSGSFWKTGKPGMLHSLGHEELDTTEWLSWTELSIALPARARLHFP